MLIAKKLLDTRGPSLARHRSNNSARRVFEAIWATGNGQDKRIDWGLCRRSSQIGAPRTSNQPEQVER